MNRLYHIFEVNEYKGGELSFKINLTYKKFIKNLLDIFDIYFDEINDGETGNIELSKEDDKIYQENDYCLTPELINKYVTKEILLEWFYNQFGVYALSDRVEEWFVTNSNGELESYGLTEEDETHLIDEVRNCFMKI